MSGLEGSQALATDPRAHASLSASAGTGKTHVLTTKVFRLLLSGAPPESILCLTFTKAGAAAMAERIGNKLASWVRMDDRALFQALEEIGENGGPEQRKVARTLFARVLDAPGGVRIQTIHAFAQSLLAAFPAEAEIAPGFKPIEGRAGDELVMRTLAEMMADAEAAGDDALIVDVATLSGRLGETGAVDYLRHCGGYAEALAALDPATIEARVRAALDLPDCDVDEFLAQRCGDNAFDCDLLRAVAAANRGWTPKSGWPAADTIENWLSLDAASRAKGLGSLRRVFLTDKLELRKQRPPSEGYDEQAGQLAAALSELLAIQNGCAFASVIAAGLRAGRAFAARYTEAKRAAGVADFDDLISWTIRLLGQAGMAEWVRFKLDQRIDHLLVDEAQDTNADQWTIIRALVADFFTGADQAGGRHRTLLTVGDFKQAIYSFQGTDPREFETVRADFKARAEALRVAADDGEVDAAALPFHDIAMATSFRSGQGVLDAVDAVIAGVGFAAMGLPQAPEPHRAAEKNAHIGGSVELWPPFAPDVDAGEDGEEEGWIDLRERQYATRLADQVKAWIDSGEVLASTGRPISAGDIMILVRSRAQLASLIVARLFAAGVPVAGIDRLHLNDPLAVQDLLAAMTFAVQPLDDLNLASLLVSPLVGWSQEQLMDLAADRKGRLWPALRNAAREGKPGAVEAHELLTGLLAMADLATPARFLETLLSGPIGGRRKLARRLGMDSRDPVDELMTSAIEFEREDIPSLERFLAWFRRGDVEIARDASAPADEVRVMTVHGAKGLEAPVVILADAHFDPLKVGRRGGPIDIELDGNEIPAIRPRKEERTPQLEARITAAEKAEIEEHWRLLYVAMTRAVERLVVAGLQPKRGEMSAQSWHNAVGAALGALGAGERADAQFGAVRRYERAGGARPKSAERAKPLPQPPVVPEWASRPAPVEEVPPRPLAPSAIAKDDVAAPRPTPAMRAAAERGTWIHALLERLVEVPPERRREVALNWLERSAGVDDAAVREEIADQVCAILSGPAYAALFGPGSLGEAPLAATLPDGRVIAGTMDRLLVEADQISVIDFKTGRVPADEASIPAAHRAQMAAYAAALEVIFPGRSVRAALLYTAGPAMFELSLG